MNRTTRFALAAALAALATPAAAQAHVTVQPAEAEAGSFTVENIRVPNERDDASTTKVAVELPDGFYFASYQAVPGWDVAVKKEKLKAPVTIEEGFEATEQVTQVTFTGKGERGRIAPGAFQDFPLSVLIPDKPGEKLTFKAVQTYSDGEDVRWIGAPDAEKPAPQLAVTDKTETAGDGHAGGKADAAATEPAVNATPAAAATAGGDEGTDRLTVLALVVGGLGLLAGLAGLASTRRRSAAA